MKYKLYKGDCLEIMDRLIEEGLTVIHKCESAFGQPIRYDIIKW